MYRTPDDNWKDVAYRLRKHSRSSDGELRMLSRRRRQEQGLMALGLGLTCLIVLMMLAATVHAFEKWNSTETPVAAVIVPTLVPTPTVLPTIPPEYMHKVRILLLGSDLRDGDPGFRTDVIVLVTIDPSGPSASAISLPRDLWVEPPALYPMKINMVQGLGGFEALAGTFESSFGARPDYYVMVNFGGFTRLIDSLDGIDVRVEQPISDRCDLPHEPDGQCDLGPGVHHMDGATALWYARSRYSSSDYDRLRRAQEVVQAVFDRLMSTDVLARLPELYEMFSQNLETNVSLGDFAPLAPAGIRLFQEPERINRYVINEEHATPGWSWNGMWILWPNYDAIRAVFEQAGALGSN